MKKICVIGSFNIDIQAAMKELPRVGETVRCSSFEVLVGGGKGANQAVSAGRVGADTAMVGCLGGRFYGHEYLKVLEENHVDAGCVEMYEDEYPGRAFVAAGETGDNVIYISPGTNDRVTPEMLRRHLDRIARRDIFLLQYEIPLETDLFIARELHERGKTVILDPAPAREVPAELYGWIDYITPNEVELEQITHCAADTEEGLKRAAGRLLEMGVKNVIAKRGREGAYLINEKEFRRFPAFQSIVSVDSTAAGDTFNGVFAFGLANGWDMERCIVTANAAAGLSVTRIGAQSAMPTAEELDRFLLAEGCPSLFS